MYRLPTIYEKLITDGFALVKKKILSDLDESAHLAHLGIKVDDVVTKDYMSLIYYLSFVRQQVDLYLLRKKTPIITEKELETIYETYKIDCILQSKVCNKYTNNLIAHFLTFPTTETSFTYRWSGSGRCTVIEGNARIELPTLLKLFGNIVEEQIPVPYGATLGQLQVLVPTATQQLLDSRYVIEGSENCCLETIFPQPVITVDNVSNFGFTVSWESSSTSFEVSLYQGDTEVFKGTQTTKTKTFSELQLGTTYLLQVQVSNCAGNSVASQEISTLPYYVTIVMDEVLQAQITLTGAVLGQNIITEYPGSFEFRFDDLQAPYYEISEILLNGVDYSDNIIYDVFQGEFKTGGRFVIPFIDSDVTITLGGGVINPCDVVAMNYSSSTNTLTISI